MSDSLKPQDALVLLKRAVWSNEHPTYDAMGESLLLSASQVHRSVQRAIAAGLARKDSRERWHVSRKPLTEFLIHGLRHVFYPVEGPPRRGIPTAFGVEPLRSALLIDADQLPVWPHPEGSQRGPSLEPLSKSAPDAALRDPKLHELLALVDALRIGRARERSLAEQYLLKRLA